MDTQIQHHHNTLVIQETRPRTIARVPITGDSFQQSILLHPRYVPESVPHELFRARVRQRGRTTDIFLEEPIIINGVEYTILNFKGTGADAEKSQQVIHPEAWWGYPSLKHPAVQFIYPFMEKNNESTKTWIRRGSDPFKRIWGALKKSDGEEEYHAEPLLTLNIPRSPHIALHTIPQEISERIRKYHGCTTHYTLSQLIRACTTNIRCDDFYGSQVLGEYQTEERARKIANIDARAINAQRELLRQGTYLHLEAVLKENRYIDGTFTDTENYDIQPINELTPNNVKEYISEIIRSSIAIISPELQTAYAQQLEQKTQLQLTRISRYSRDFYVEIEDIENIPELREHASIKLQDAR